MKILRLEGSDGKISCIVKTEPCNEASGLSVKNATEFEDYLPYREKISFNHGENEKCIYITLVQENVKQIESKTIGAKQIDEDDLSNEDGPGQV